jgi:hypothetical protein
MIPGFIVPGREEREGANHSTAHSVNLPGSWWGIRSMAKLACDTPFDPDQVFELEWNLFVTAQILFVPNVLATHGKVAYDSGNL